MVLEFGIFVLCILVPITLVSLTKNKISELKIRETNAYDFKIREMPDFSYESVTEEDVKLLKRRGNTPVFIITFTIIMDLLTITVLFGALDDLSSIYKEILLMMVIVSVLSAISIGKSVRAIKRFKCMDKFQKTSGCILKYKEQHFSNKYKGASAFQVLVGYKNEHGKPVVVRDSLSQLFFREIKQGAACQVILENGMPVAIVPGAKDTGIPAFSAEISMQNKLGKMITVLVGVWMIAQCILNFALEFSFWNSFSLLFGLALFYVSCLRISKANYVIAVFLLVYAGACILCGVNVYITFYIVQGMLDAACAMIMFFLPSVREHFAEI